MMIFYLVLQIQRCKSERQARVQHRLCVYSVCIVGVQALLRSSTMLAAVPPPPTQIAYPFPTPICPPNQLNELHNGLLMACVADGAVRVWRNYAERGQQRLASAWQAVLVPAAGAAGLRPAVYHWSPGYSALFAAGGRSAGERLLPPFDS